MLNAYRCLLLLTFFWLQGGLDISDGHRKDWYESGKVKGGFDFKVDFNMDIKRVNRGETREYIMEFRVVR